MGAAYAMQIGLGNLDSFSYFGSFSGTMMHDLDVEMQRGTRAEIDKVGIKYVDYDSPGTAHEWLTWRRDLHEFAQLLFKK